jgi:sarcosine oxidase, subunit gamma
MLKTALDFGSIIRVQSWNTHSGAPAIESAPGVSWPSVVGVVARGRADILCIGPADWLVVAGDCDANILRQWLGGVFEDPAFRATDLSQAFSRIEIKGAEVRDLLAKGCSLDLHPPLFAPGRAVCTRFAGMPVIVHCTGAFAFELIVTRSYVEYLMSWLADAELEFDEF